MKRYFAVEMKPLVNINVRNLELFFRQMYTLVDICCEFEQLLIVESEEEQEKLKEYLQQNDGYEDHFSLYYLEKSEQKQCFFDYGFCTVEDECFLYEELVTAFSITGGREEQIFLALMQIEEDLIAVNYAQQPLYFIDKQKVDLIHKYAQAYEISVEFVEYFGQARQML